MIGIGTGPKSLSRKAAILEPGSAEVINGQAYLARRLGRTDEAIELYKLAVGLDPLRADFQLTLGYELFYQGRYEEALAALQKAEELNPQLSSLYMTRGKIFFSEGRKEEALAEMEKEKRDGERWTGEALAYYALGRTEDSNRALKQLIAAHQNDSAFQIGEIYAYRGEVDKAFEWLERAYRQRDSGLPEMKTSPLMKSLLSDPRRAELLKKMGLPQLDSTSLVPSSDARFGMCKHSLRKQTPHQRGIRHASHRQAICPGPHVRPMFPRAFVHFRKRTPHHRF